MDAKEMLRKLASHPVVRADMAMQVQLGIPFLEVRQGKLCVRCLPHREEYQAGFLDFYKPQYEITWVYPFDKIIRFEDAGYFSSEPCGKPVISLKAEVYALRGKLLLKDLYDQCSGLLAVYEAEGTASDAALRRYQKACREAVRELGLAEIYEVYWS